MKWLFAFALLLVAPATRGQVFQVNAGDSTLFGASAVEVTMHGSNDLEGVSMGDFSGHVLLGAFRESNVMGWDTTLGDKSVSLISNGQGISAPLLGIFATKENPKKKQRISFFIGALGAAYWLPYGFSQQPQHFGMGYSFDRKIKRWEFNSLGALEGNQKTLLEGVSWNRSWLSLSGTGGLFQNSHLWNGTATFQTRHFAANLNDETLLLLTQRADVTSESISGQDWHFDAHAGLIQGRAGQINTSGRNVGVGIRLFDNKLLVHSEYYASKSSSIVSTSFSEIIRRKLTLVETETESGAQRNFDVGADYSTNAFSVGVTHNELFYPLLANPWQRTLSIHLSFRLPRNSAMNLATVALPNAKIRYSVYGGTYVYHDVDTSGLMQESMGKFEVSGKVLDSNGSPVSGASIRVEKETVYSEDDGSFSLRVKKNRAYPVVVQVDQFLLGVWEIANAPDAVTPGQPVVITVRRK
jgi:hypothetical protein